MTTEPFKPGEKVWVGRWIAGEFQRLAQGEVLVEFLDCQMTPWCLTHSEGLLTSYNPNNLERIHNDLNERLK